MNLTKTLKPQSSHRPIAYLSTALLVVLPVFCSTSLHGKEPFGGRPRYIVPSPISMGNIPHPDGIGSPSITGNGLTLAFDAGGNPLQIGTTTRPSLDEDWGAGGLLGDVINSDGRNYAPELSDDGLEL